MALGWQALGAQKTRKPLEQGGALEQVAARIERVMGLTPELSRAVGVGLNEMLGRNTNTERDMKTQWWLAELDMHGNPELTDGAHSVRAGAEKALTLMQRLGLAKDRHFAIAEVRLTEPTGEHGQINEEAIATLNAIGLRPNA